MDFEIPNVTSSLEVMMGGASVIQVEMDSVQVEQQYHRDLDNENNNMVIDGIVEELPLPTAKQESDVSRGPEEVAVANEDQKVVDPAPVVAQNNHLIENDTSTIAASTPTPAPPAGLQIVTRKRSSLSAPPQGSITGAAHPPAQAEVKVEPAKKKKKWTPKPKASPAVPKPNPPPRPKKKAPAKKQPASSSAKKGTKSSAAPTPVVKQENSDEQEQLQLLPPPLKLQLPKLTKIPQLQLQMQQNLHQNQEEPQPPTLELESSTATSHPSLIPLALVKEEPLDYENNEECCEPGLDNILEHSGMEVEQEDADQVGGEGGDAPTTITVATSGSSGKPSRKKKSKGRNGNIYIGVFNRIEWMKLQEEYGFQSVNNFGTFVLQTMRKLHGDISFWCNLAKASGVYPELEKYVWRNGFPHAVNNEGEAYSPPEVDLTDEKREEVVELAKSMWEKRITELRQQAQQEEQQAAEGNGGTGGGEVITLPEEGEDDEEGEEEEKEDPGLENYLENMASGKYSLEIGMGGAKSAVGSPGGEAEVKVEGGGGGDGNGQEGKPGLLSAEQVNTIWNEQVSNVQSLEEYGKVFSLINSIHHQENLEGVGKGSDEVVEEGENQ